MKCQFVYTLFFAHALSQGGGGIALYFLLWKYGLDQIKYNLAISGLKKGNKSLMRRYSIACHIVRLLVSFPLHDLFPNTDIRKSYIVFAKSQKIAV